MPTGPEPEFENMDPNLNPTCVLLPCVFPPCVVPSCFLACKKVALNNKKDVIKKKITSKETQELAETNEQLPMRNVDLPTMKKLDVKMVNYGLLQEDLEMYFWQLRTKDDNPAPRHAPAHTVRNQHDRDAAARSRKEEAMAARVEQRKQAGLLENENLLKPPSRMVSLND